MRFSQSLNSLETSQPQLSSSGPLLHLCRTILLASVCVSIFFFHFCLCRTTIFAFLPLQDEHFCIFYFFSILAFAGRAFLHFLLFSILAFAGRAFLHFCLCRTSRGRIHLAPTGSLTRHTFRQLSSDLLSLEWWKWKCQWSWLMDYCDWLNLG